MGPFSPEELEPTRRPLLEAFQLPPRAFVDEAVAAWEAEHLFLGGWLCMGHTAPVSERGAFLTREAGGESVLVVGDDEGRARAFFNVCRHRGARLVDEPAGRVRRLQCPYHAWSYGFDGSLRNAPHTDGIEGFDPGCHGLTPVRTRVLEGLVFCDASGVAPPLEQHVGALAGQLARYRLATLRRAAGMTYDVAANWKAIVQNYSECLHCPGVHPELNRLSHYLSGVDFDGPGAWCGGSMTLVEGTATMATGGDGRWPPIAGVNAGEVLYFALLPNLLISLHPDYAMLHTLWPRGAGRTEVVCEWFFEPATMAGDGFDPAPAVEFWSEVNRQDWRVCELTQKGVGSRGFRRGRYTANEHTVHAFDRMMCHVYLGLEAAAGCEEPDAPRDADRRHPGGDAERQRDRHVARP
jgi:glycine betaine catabolism A